MLEFDAGPHVYRWNGAVVPSVTQIIQPCIEDTLRFVPRDKLELARAEGVAVHRMAELHFKKRLARVPTWQEGCMDALLSFVEKEHFEFIASEERLYHPTMGYAGTYDLRGWIGPRLALIDIKRSFFAGRAIGLQLAGYKRLVEAQKIGNVPHVIGATFALILGKDGQYELKEYRDPRDDAAFLAALTLWKWQRQGAAA